MQGLLGTGKTGFFLNYSGKPLKNINNKRGTGEGSDIIYTENIVAIV